jgi:DNA-binding NarL/FixJ family response regulator
VIRVLLADDQELVRTGFVMILGAQDDLEVVGEAASGEEAVAAVAKHHPDVVLMDVRMPGIDGIEATRRITSGHAPGEGPKVLVLTTFDLDEYVREALAAGASGFLLKDTPAADLVNGIRIVARGDALLAPSVTRRLISELVPRRADPAAAAAIEGLTEKERTVLTLVARGLSNAEIGGEMFISEATVKTHVGHVLAKLGVRDRVQAVVVAYETGLVRPGDPAPAREQQG